MGMKYPYRVFGLHLAGRSTYAEDDNEYLRSITITFEDSGTTGNFDPDIDLASDPRAPYPNVSIWRDTDRDGVFNPNIDTLITHDPNSDPLRGKHVTFSNVGPGKWTATLTYDSYQFPLDKQADSTYFLVVSTKPDYGSDTQTPRYGADFKVYIENPSDVVVARKYGVGPAVFSQNFLDIYKEGVKNVQVAFDLKPFAYDPAEADGVPVAIFGINMCDSRDTGVNDALEWIRVWFKGENGFKPNHLAPLSDSPDSGVSLWKDNKTAGYIGVPDPRYISPADMLEGKHSLTIADTYVPLSADSLEWYNSDGTKWSPTNDDPTRPEGSKLYYVVLKPKTPLPLYDDDYVQDPLGTGYKGFDYFICVKARGVSVPDTGYKDDVDPLKRGIDYGMSIHAAIGLFPNGSSTEPWKDILFSSGFNARVSYPVEATTPKSTVPTFFTNLTFPNQTVNYFEKKAVIGINLVAPPNEDFSFDRFAFILIDEGDQNVDFSELVDPNADRNDPNGGCGIALYKDTNKNGFFDSQDKRVWMTAPPELQRNLSDPDNWRRVILHLEPNPDNVTSPIHTAAIIPTTDTDNDLGPDYFLVIQPNQFMDAGDDFSIMLWGSDILGEMDDTLHFTDRAGTEIAYPPITYKRVKTYTLTNSTVSSTKITDMIQEGMEVDPESEPIAAIGIDVYDPTNTNKLVGARAYFNPVNSIGGIDKLTPDKVLKAINSNGRESGISIWVDTNKNGLFEKAIDTPVDIQNTTWKDDFTYGYVCGPHTKIPAGTPLKNFSRDDKIYWLDYDKNGIWSSGDSLWIDNNGNGIYDNADTLLAGEGRVGEYGVNLHDYVYGFAYYDSNGNNTYDSNEDDVYFIGRGRNTLGYYVDLNLLTPPSLPIASDNNKPDFFIVFRTGSDIEWKDEFSFSLPSNAIRFTSGTSFST